MTLTEQRIKFSKNETILTMQMISDGVEYIKDWLLRTADAQKILFDKGYSKCDGTVKKSKHQSGLAIDIYFLVDGEIDYGFVTERSQLLAEKYHKLWVQLGGSPMILWDKCHYQMP